MRAKAGPRKRPAAGPTARGRHAAGCSAVHPTAERAQFQEALVVFPCMIVSLLRRAALWGVGLSRAGRLASDDRQLGAEIAAGTYPVPGCWRAGIGDERFGATDAGDGDGIGNTRVRDRAAQPRVWWPEDGHDGRPGSTGGIGPRQSGGCLRSISIRAAHNMTGECWQIVLRPARAIQDPSWNEQMIVHDGNAWRSAARTNRVSASETSPLSGSPGRSTWRVAPGGPEPLAIAWSRSSASIADSSPPRVSAVRNRVPPRRSATHRSRA